jgi:hypothetical protein
MHIDLTERQHARIAQLAKELEVIDGKITPLEDTRRAFQMAIQAMMATILEAADVPQDQQYTLSADLKRLVLAQEE